MLLLCPFAAVMTSVSNYRQRRFFMKNYQKLSYQEYRIMLSDGSSIVTTRQECFSIEPASEGCPFKQRWYYSPDQYMAVRLPRNELGERLGKDNAADLKAQERLIARNRERNTEIDAYTTEDSVSFEIPDPDSVLFLHRLFTGKNTVRQSRVPPLCLRSSTFPRP